MFQVLTEHKLELLKVKFQNELEAPLREICTKLEQECDFYRNEFNKVRYESTLLKAEFDHQQKEQSQLLEENRLKHQTEINQINEECQELRSRLSTGAVAQERRRADALETGKVILGQKITSLEVELAEIRARADDARNRAEGERRTLAQQLADTQAALSIAESEGQISREHAEQAKREENKCREQNLQLSTKLRRAERDTGAQLAKMEEMKHVHTREVTSIRLEAAQCRTQLEQEKDDVQDQLEALRTELHFEKEEQAKLEKRLVAASKDATQREHSAQQQESARYTALLQQKLELEMLQSQAEDREASFLAERSRWEEERTACQAAKEMITREVLALRNELQQTRSDLQKCDKTEVESLNKNLEAVREDIRKLSASEHELSQENGWLQEAARHKDSDIKHLTAMLERAQTEAERLMQIHQVEWLEEKHHLIDRNTQLDKRLAEAKNKIRRAAAAQNKRKKLNQLREKRFVEKLQLLKAQKEEIELQNNIFKKNVPHGEHDRLRRCLKELQRRHDEFRNIILGYVVPGQRLTSLMPSFESSGAALQERQHQHEVKMLKQRLEEVERNQRLQLQELTGPAPDPFPPATHR
uniref:centrosomal protein of 83 kDa-like isoform X3 n=1 Tax=Myxine glutinosa TaxID=7769 RepID=UPI00359012BC